MAKARKKPAKKKSAKKTTAKKTAAKKKSVKKKPMKKKPVKKKTTNKKSRGKKAAPKKKSSVKKKVAVKKNAAPKKKTTATRPVKSPSVKFEKLISPLADRLVVRVEGPSEKTVGGLFIPGTVSERPNQGEVLACGPGSKNKKGHLRPLDVKVGDKVLFNSYAGINAQIEGQDVLILREEEVLGVLSTM